MADKVDAEDNEYLRVHETTDWAVVQSVIIINLAICEQHVAIMTFYDLTRLWWSTSTVYFSVILAQQHQCYRRQQAPEGRVCY